MTRINHKILFTALGFLAVLVKDNMPHDKQAVRAIAVAKLIEDFCAASLPEQLAVDGLEHTSTLTSKQLLNRYTEELRDTGSAKLDYDRQTLLGMYEVLLAEKVWREQQEFFASGHADVIANRILQLVTEQLEAEAQA